MQDAEIPLGIFALDLETQQPKLFNRESPVLVADAIRSSIAIPFFFRAHKIPGEKGLFVDGGITSNFAMEIWDDVPTRRTVGVCFRSSYRRRSVRHGVGYVTALVGSMLDNTNRAHISKKRMQDIITIKTEGNCMDFTLSDLEVEARFHEGWQAVEEWIKNGKS
jgi:predicted acylesterase/phospholipase RssA